MVGVSRPPELSTARLAAADVVIDVAVGSGSTEPFALSFEGWATAGRSATDSSTADNLCGALREIKDGVTKKTTTREGARLND